MSISWSNITWLDVKNDINIDAIEHPILNNFYVDKDEYEKEFGKVLEYMDGETMSDYISFFFRKVDFNDRILEFISDSERLDFYDYAQELGCCPSLQETHEGECKEDKEKRKMEEQRQREAMEKQRLQQLKKKAQVTQEEKDRKKILSMFRSLSDPKFKAKQNKYEKTKDRFDMEYKDYRDTYKKEIDGITV